MTNPELDIVEADNDMLRKEIQRLKEERDEARRLACFLRAEIEEENDNFGYDPHTEAEAARAEEGKKRQEEYRQRHEERMARIASTRKNAEGKNNPPF